MTSGAAERVRVSSSVQPNETAVRGIDRLPDHSYRTLSRWTRCRRPTPGRMLMAMAPVVYCLWQQLRFDPDDPIWPNLLRIVRPVTQFHAAVLAAALVPGEGSGSGLRDAGQVEASRWTTLKTVPATRQLPGSSQHHLRRRDHHRSAGTGRGYQRRHGARGSLAGWPSISTGPGFEMAYPPTRGRRRMHDGGRQR